MNNQIDYGAAKTLPEFLALLRAKGVPENQLWLHAGKYQEMKAREKGIPFSGQFELTPLCNLDCKMCYVHLDRAQLRGRAPLDVGQWKSIMAQAHAMGMMSASLTGGECLTYPGFDELYLYLRSLGVRTGIKTNGVLLKEKMDLFRRFPPSEITVSLYGSSNEAYQRVTGHAVFDTVYEGLTLLRDAEYPVSIAITPSRYLYEDLEQIFALAKRFPFRLMVNVALFPPRKETGRELCDLTAEEYAEIARVLHEGDPAASEAPPLVPDPQECQPIEGKLQGLPCAAGRSMFSVEWDGQLAGCDNLLNSLRISLLKQSFSEAWKQVHAEAVAYPLPVECLHCAYDKKCFDCVAYRCNGSEPGHCNPNICERTRLFVKQGLRI